MTVLVGDLDINELTVLFFKMGMDLIPRRVQELMVQFDVDQGGSIEFNDYLLMLNAISKVPRIRAWMFSSVVSSARP